MKKLTILSLIIVATTLSLSAADAKKHAKGPAPTEAQLKTYDKNKDGKIDKNDGLTKEEMKAYRTEQKNAAPAK